MKGSAHLGLLPKVEDELNAYFTGVFISPTEDLKCMESTLEVASTVVFAFRLFAFRDWQLNILPYRPMPRTAFRRM